MQSMQDCHVLLQTVTARCHTTTKQKDQLLKGKSEGGLIYLLLLWHGPISRAKHTACLVD